MASPELIRTVLNRDRPWCAYALGDLSPRYREHARWLVGEGPEAAVLLLYSAFRPPVLFAAGPADGIERLLPAVPEPEVQLSMRPEALPAIRTRYAVERPREMWRMVLNALAPIVLGDGIARLNPSHVPALRALYADGAGAGESPDAFAPEMVRSGVYFGAWEGDVIVAAAGTHLVAPEEGVAAVGNVYTRQDHRGRGLARRLVHAVCVELTGSGIRTVVLNVAEDNAAARRAYERVGFHRHCRFYDGGAMLR
jgi:ribosomal protein S18 acetylase RimI-like enzyme